MDKQLLTQLCDEYTLGLLEGEELQQIERLIQSDDPAAREQLKKSEALVAELVLSAAAVAEPPALLRSQLTNRIGDQERSRTAERAVATRPRSGSWVTGWAVAAGLAVASLYSFMALRGANSELRRVEGQLASVRTEAARSRKVLEVVFARDARFIRLSTAAPNEPQFRAFWGGSAGLVLSGLDVPALKQGRTLQLWVVPKGGGNPVSAGVFAPQANGQVLLIAETQLQPGQAAALAISDEPEGGSPQPTTKPVFVGAMGE